jgi:uncharacterized protein YgbK (DUF1537 family)
LASEQSQIVAVSGSVSPITASQIDWAEANGFDLNGFAAEASLDEHRWLAEIDAAVERAEATLSSGRSPLVVTARGPNDEAVTRFRAKLAASGRDPCEINARIGEGLGEILRRLIGEGGVTRAAVSGGDTSGFAMRALGAYALEAVAAIAPGAPLCRVFSTDPKVDGIEIALKGGQMGKADFFGSVRGTRDNFWRNEVTKIALLGAGGKMACACRRTSRTPGSTWIMSRCLKKGARVSSRRSESNAWSSVRRFRRPTQLSWPCRTG